MALHMSGTTTDTLTWSVPTPDMAVFGGGSSAAATATALSATAQGANLVLTATVSPAAAGTVTFAEGSSTLDTVAVSGGTAATTVVAPAEGSHTYTAAFAPADSAAYAPSSVQQSFVVAKAADGSITVTLAVPGAPLGDPGALTLSVPASAAIALAGARDSGNTRVTAAGDLPTITVTDTHRADLQTAWQVNVQATDFTSAEAGTIGAKYLGVQPAVPATAPISGTPTVVQAGATVASYLDDQASSGLAEAKELGHVATAGQGTTTLGGRVNLAVGPDAAQGTYTSVITVTLIGG
jgi:hypothetical protein